MADDLDAAIRERLDAGTWGADTPPVAISDLPAPAVYVDALRAVLDLHQPEIMEGWSHAGGPMYRCKAGCFVRVGHRHCETVERCAAELGVEVPTDE